MSVDASPTRDWVGHDAGSSGYRRILIGLFAAGIGTFGQMYSTQGILPTLGRALEVNEASAALTVSMATLGLSVSVLGWSWLADRIGRAPAMKIAMSFSLVLGLLTPIAPGFTTLLVLRSLEGLALGGVPALAVAYLAEEIHSRHVSVAAAIYISGTTVGGLLGRVVTGPFADLGGWRTGVAAGGILSAVAVIIAIALIPRAQGWVRPTGKPTTSVRQGVLANLRDPGMLVLYGQAALLMGGFVATYNYLGYRLEGEPFGLPVAISSQIFFAYLGGTVSSSVAGRLAATHGRRKVMLTCVVVMIVGVLMTLPDNLVMILAGLLILTTGFFGAHGVASGWVGARARVGKAQASALYNLFYYGGSSLFGWLLGYAYVIGWTGLATAVLALALASLTWSFFLARD
ncbi:putative MFS family arabinose efflux permease [Nocardioides luteus]|uniref:MFS transporter n=1 Tax=Nocardioides luteus TaxID=1844 RepID=A0ABQ5SZM9_9ACTN|nr:MFS transporter [Nocardioides luteus]MDR7312678.1 putative MFS family arabinose efflux permease [Nocardioides luteus]GGR46784.1 MFS transporter [Nocardioides luteus]GLJ68927.1 MFS transporter [Nocardioides luteus]